MKQQSVLEWIVAYQVRKGEVVSLKRMVDSDGQASGTGWSMRDQQNHLVPVQPVIPDKRDLIS
jgi:hypothetical protein